MLMQQSKPLIIDPDVRGRVSEEVFVEVIKDMWCEYKITSVKITRNHPELDWLDHKWIDVVVTFEDIYGNKYTIFFQIKSSDVYLKEFYDGVTKEFLDWVHVVNMDPERTISSVETRIRKCMKHAVELGQSARTFLRRLKGKKGSERFFKPVISLPAKEEPQTNPVVTVVGYILPYLSLIERSMVMESVRAVEAFGSAHHEIGEELSSRAPDRAKPLPGVVDVDGHPHTVYIIDEDEYHQLMGLKKKGGMYADISFWRYFPDEKVLKPLMVKKALSSEITRVAKELQALRG